MKNGSSVKKKKSFCHSPSYVPNAFWKTVDSNFSVVDDLKFLNIYVNGDTGSINNLSSVWGLPILIFIKSSSIIFSFIHKEILNSIRI